MKPDPPSPGPLPAFPQGQRTGSGMGILPGLVVLSLLLVSFSSAWNLWLLYLLPRVEAQRALQIGSLLACLIPLNLACWAVPLGCFYRLRYDRRIPAGLPSWREDSSLALMAHFRSPWWRAYAQLFGWSLLLLPLQAIFSGWFFLGCYGLGLSFLASRAWLRQARENQRLTTRIDLMTGNVSIPELGEFPAGQARFWVKPELEVTPRRDTQVYWVMVGEQRWRRFELEEQAQQLASWMSQSQPG